MKIRGRRECQECTHQWSYYETGSVACPACGSLRSVGVDDRTIHTASPVELDLADHRSAVDERGIADAAPDLKRDLRAYRRRRGFIHGGELRPLDGTLLAACELLHAVDIAARRRTPTDDEQFYVFELLRGADAGARVAPEDIPDSMTEARGMGVADAVENYRRDLKTWLTDHPDGEASKTLDTIASQRKRIEALSGDVSVETADALVEATRDLTRYLVDADESALVTARDRLTRLGYSG